MDASNLLSPRSPAGTLRCIGSTTFEEFRQHFEKDQRPRPPLPARRGHGALVEDTTKILEGLRSATRSSTASPTRTRRSKRRATSPRATSRPPAPGQGHRPPRRGRAPPCASRTARANEVTDGGRRRGPRAHGADPAARGQRDDKEQLRNLDERSQEGRLRSGRGHRARSPPPSSSRAPACARPRSRSAPSSSPAPPASARPRSPSSSPRCWASRSCAST